MSGRGGTGENAAGGGTAGDRTGGNGAVNVELNGDRIELEGGSRVADVVARLGADSARRGVAVAVDGEVVPRSAWEETALRDGQSIEVVGAIQGG